MLFLGRLCNKIPKICVIYFLYKVLFYIARGRRQKSEVREKGLKGESSRLKAESSKLKAKEQKSEVGGQRSGNRRKAEISKVKGLCIDDCDRMEKYLINLKAYRLKR